MTDCTHCPACASHLDRIAALEAEVERLRKLMGKLIQAVEPPWENWREDVETVLRECDVIGCEKEASCGTPTNKGYRRTCHDHPPQEGSNHE